LKSSPRFAGIPGQLRWDLSQSIELNGDLDRDDGLFDKARERFNEAFEIRRQLVIQSPDNNEWGGEFRFYMSGSVISITIPNMI
jgi:hypothetical protein